MPQAPGPCRDAATPGREKQTCVSCRGVFPCRPTRAPLALAGGHSGAAGAVKRPQELYAPALFAEAQIVPLVFVIAHQLMEDAVFRQPLNRLLDLLHVGVAVDDRLRAF